MRKGLSMTAAQVAEHQQRHGFAKGFLPPQGSPHPPRPVKPRQNATEREYGLILEAMKRRGEILDYRPFGIKLEWGADPQSGKPMVYSPDFIVWGMVAKLPTITLIEVKGSYIRPQDWIRFKGCRAEWPMFRFELHQKTSEGWRKLL